MKHHQASSPPDSPRTNRKMDMVVRSVRREMGYTGAGLLAVRPSTLLMGVCFDIAT